LILGKKVWMTWDLDLGKPDDPQQRYFTEEQLKKIIEAAEGQHRILFALLAGTGMRIGEAAGLHVDDLDLDNCVIYVRRGVWNGQELSPKTKNAVREIDIDPGLAELLKQHIGVKKAGRVFEARNGSPISGNNVLKRVLHPLLERLEIPKAGLHAFRHSRVTCCEKTARRRTCRSSGLGILTHSSRARISPSSCKQSWTQFRCWTQWTQKRGRNFDWKCLKRMVRPERFELPTFWFVARRSIQLS